MKKSNIFLTILFAVLVIALSIIVTVQILPIDKAIDIFGFKPLVVMSGSMSGEFEVMDMLVVGNADPNYLKAGDVITFYPPNATDEKYISHYIAEITPNENDWEIRTKPNLTEQWDDWVLSSENIIGKELFVIPKIGYVVLPLQDPRILINLTGLVLIIIAIIVVIKAKPKEKV